VCFTNESFSAKIDAQLIEGDDEISTISLVCCGGNKGGTFPASDIQVGSVQVFGPASTNPWSSTVVARQDDRGSETFCGHRYLWGVPYICRVSHGQVGGGSGECGSGYVGKDCLWILTYHFYISTYNFLEGNPIKKIVL
jgi:hypothetical protein